LSAGGVISRIIAVPRGTTTSSLATGTACDGQLFGSDHLSDAGGGGVTGPVGAELSALQDPKTAIGSATATTMRARDFNGGMGVLFMDDELRRGGIGGKSQRSERLRGAP
jgi:hypothetical protein